MERWKARIEAEILYTLRGTALYGQLRRTLKDRDDLCAERDELRERVVRLSDALGRCRSYMVPNAYADATADLHPGDLGGDDG